MKKNDKYFENLKKHVEWMNTYKMTCDEHGQKPITRRDFLDAGLIGFSATLALPTIFSLLSPAKAHAQLAECPTADATQALMPALITLHLSGGANLAGNYVPLDAGGQLLPSYNKLGMGDNQLTITREFNNIPFFNLSGILAGFQQTSTQATRDKVSMVAIPVTNKNDGGGDDNEFDITGLVSRAGLIGETLPNVFNRGSRGGNQISGPAGDAVPPNIEIGRVDDLVNAVTATGTLAKLNTDQRVALFKTIENLNATQTNKLASLSGGDAMSFLTGCAAKKNVELAQATPPGLDARQDATIANIWGINANSAANDKNAIYASAVSAVLSGSSGSTLIADGGYDYHRGRSRQQANAKDVEAGQIIGRILESAAAQGRKTFLYVISNGANGSNSNDRQTDWTSADDSDKGMAWFMVFDPAARPETTGFQIGQFNSQQAVDNSFITGPSSRLTGMAAFANYLKFAGKLDLFQQIAPNVFDTAQLNSILKIA